MEPQPRNESSTPKRLVVIGAGPAGLTAALENLRHGGSSVVLEKDGIVGGIARTAEHRGYRFDIGGHRFFTKVKEVDDLWHELLKDELIRVPRQSRILYRRKLFSYPLKPIEAFFGLGPIESIRCGLSFLRSRIAPRHPEEDLETWVSNRFGKRLFEIFFKTYTEKVWGVSCTEIRAEWAAQRIRGLSLWKAVWTAVRKDPSIKTLIEEFDYPRLGPGQMWEAFRTRLEAAGSPVLLERPVTRIRWQAGIGVSAVQAGPAGSGESFSGDAYLSSMPIRELVAALDPPPPPEIAEAANRLRYRDFICIALMFEGERFFPDNWIYIHSPELRVGRIQNFNNWSADLVPRKGVTCLGLEYFCFETDPLWTTPDTELLALGRKEIVGTGLVPASAPVVDGAVVRMQKTYPMYDPGYGDAVDLVRRWIEAHLPNLQLVGRNGMHKYNNQDHAMVTGMYAVRNLYGAAWDLWKVNVDAEYHEEVREAPARRE